MIPPHRLKMGVCEGHPKSIIPDHLARADYHGASVNQSARYMDAGEGTREVVLTQRRECQERSSTLCMVPNCVCLHAECIMVSPPL